MKKKIIIALLALVVVFLLCKIINFVIINKTYKAIENFKENSNRYYSARIKRLNEDYTEKIFLNNEVVKYVFLNDNENLYCEWKNTNTNEYYYINVMGKVVSTSESVTIYRDRILMNLPIIISNIYYSDNKNILSFLKIKYILPTKYEDKICFKIITDSEILIIDAKTYLPKYVLRNPIDSNNKEMKTEIFYEFEIDTVTEEDVELPDLSRYQKIE